MKIFIVILHFGDSQITINCLRSIKNKLSYDGLIVVDNNQNFNGSNFKEKLKIIKNNKNLGFAGGINVGIKHALSQGADYVLLLNNDTLVKDNFLDKLMSIFKKYENAGITGPLIKFKKDGRLVYDFGGKINKIFGRTTHNERSRILNKGARIVDYVSGCCMLVKKDVFKKIGLFDERFFLYYEDVDFCIRARNKGYLTYVSAESSIEHSLSKTVGKVSPIAVYNQTKSAFIFGKKYYRKTIILNRLFIFVQTAYVLIKNPRVGISALWAFKYI